MHVKAIKMRWETGGLNYSYLVSTHDRTASWLIDPAEPHEVLAALSFDEKQSVVAVANTHHHKDHSGGNIAMQMALREVSPMMPVIAGSEASPACTEVPKHLQIYKLGPTVTVLCIRTPCHTKDSVCYLMEDTITKEYALFTGDTLFTAGCGRFFEGTARDMDIALNERIVNCVGMDNIGCTKVYPGHEYTKGNVEFIRKFIYTNRGDNVDFDRLEDYVLQKEVTTGHFTVKDEMKFNPFMRLDDKIVRRKVGDFVQCWDRTRLMARLREMKNLR